MIDLRIIQVQGHGGVVRRQGGETMDQRSTCAQWPSAKLQMLHRAARLDDLRVPPNNKLEALKHDRRDQHSIRINDQWRVCFASTTATPSTWRSSTTTDQGDAHRPHRWHAVDQPGEVLREEFLLAGYEMALARGALAGALADIKPWKEA